MKKYLLLCGLGLLGVAAYLWAQPGGGRPMGASRGMGMGMGGAFALEGDWALICFELKVEGKDFDKLRAEYQKAWNQRQELMAKMRQGELDPTALTEEMALIQEELDKSLGVLLTDAQRQTLNRLRAERREAWQGGGQRGRGQRPGQP